MAIKEKIPLLTNDQRGQWNSFLDNLQGHPVTEEAINDYAKNTPDFSIKAEMIPQIQQEHTAIRTGESFGDINSEQLQALREGMSPKFIEATDLSKLYYPQFKIGGHDFGTNSEDYLKAKNATTSIAVNSLPPTTFEQSEMHNIINANEGGGGGAKNIIPKPNYSDPASRFSYAKAWTQKYGPLMQGRGDTPLRVNEIPEGTDDDNLTAKEMSVKAAGNLKLDPALLYASAMEEGMSGLWGSDKKLVDYSGDDKFPIDGFVNFGLDNFSDFYPQLVKKGYLPEDFKNQFKKQVQTNELGSKVNSANFKTAESALQAKAAVMRNTQDETEAYANKNGIPLSPAAKDFFTLVNYNAGVGSMQKMLKEYDRNGYLKNDKFLEKRPSASWKGPYENVIRRIKMADALKKEGLFD